MTESAPYIGAMYDDHGPGSPHIPPWLITGRRYRNLRLRWADAPPAAAAPLAPGGRGTSGR